VAHHCRIPFFYSQAAPPVKHGQHELRKASGRRLTLATLDDISSLRDYSPVIDVGERHGCLTIRVR
jgi:hypothetical protein